MQMDVAHSQGQSPQECQGRNKQNKVEMYSDVK